MSVEPKPQKAKELGGFLLNNDDYIEKLIIPKTYYRKNSDIKHNLIYNTVNRLSRIPYKINTPLLEFILLNGETLGILLDTKLIDDFDNDKKTRKTKLRISEYKAYKSKYLLQSYILEIAEMFRKHKLYFPVRLDQKGRVYCNTTYFNYQTTDLAKALLLFDTPGYIEKHKPEGADYLKIFGADASDTLM